VGQAARESCSSGKKQTGAELSGAAAKTAVGQAA